MKTIILLTFVSLVLAACGGGNWPSDQGQVWGDAFQHVADIYEPECKTARKNRC